MNADQSEKTPKMKRDQQSISNISKDEKCQLTVIDPREQQLLQLKEDIKNIYQYKNVDVKQVNLLGNFESLDKIPNLQEVRKQEIQLIKSKLQNKMKSAPQRYTMEIPSLIQNTRELQIPADFSVAQDYDHARQIGVPKISENSKICPLSGRFIEREKINHFQCMPEDLQFLGSAYPLYFDYLQFCILMLLTLFFTTGCYNLVSNWIMGEDCFYGHDIDAVLKEHTELHREQFCKLNWQTWGSLANQRSNDKLLKVGEIINLFSMIAMIAVFQFLRKSQREMEYNCDTPHECDDYTILVKNVPQSVKLVGLEHTFTTLFKEKHNIPRITQISPVFNTKQRDKQLKEQKILTQQFQKELQYYIKDFVDFKPNSRVIQILEEIEKQQNQYNLIMNKFQEYKDEAYLKSRFTGITFISFSNQDRKISKLYFISQIFIIYKLDVYQILDHKQPIILEGSELIITKALHPEQIYFKNLRYSKREILRQYIIGIIIDISVQLFCMAFQMAVKVFNKWYQDMFHLKTIKNENAAAKDILHIIQRGLDWHTLLSILITFILSYIVLLLNEQIQDIKTWSEEKQGHENQTKLNVSKAKKLAILQFFNTSIINFIITVLWIRIHQGPEEASRSIFQEKGLIDTQHNIFLVLSMINNVKYYFDIKKFLKQFKQWLIKRKIEKCILTQQQINVQEKSDQLTKNLDLYNQRAYEEENFDISQRYGAVTGFMYSTAFYSPLLPVILIYSSINIIILYFIDKYKLLNHRIVKNRCNSTLAKEMTSMLQLMLPIYCIGNAVFEMLIRASNGNSSGISVISWIGISIGIIHGILPMDQLNQKLFPVQIRQPSHLPYEEVHNEFDIVKYIKIIHFFREINIGLPSGKPGFCIEGKDGVYIKIDDPNQNWIGLKV